MIQGQFFYNATRIDEISNSLLGTNYHHMQTKTRSSWMYTGHLFTIRVVSLMSSTLRQQSLHG